MMAAVTIVVCLTEAPQSCEIRETSVDAVLCFAASRNVAEQEVPEGYTSDRSGACRRRGGRQRWTDSSFLLTCQEVRPESDT